MAGRVEIPIVEVVREGVLAGAATSSDAANGHFLAANDGDVELEVWNDSGTAQSVLVHSNPSLMSDGLTVVDLVLTVPSGATAGDPAKYGPFRPNTFKQDVNGMMYLDPSVSTDLKIRAFKRAQARNSGA